MVPGFPGVVPGNLGLITGYQVAGPEYLARVPGYSRLSNESTAHNESTATENIICGTIWAI